MGPQVWTTGRLANPSSRENWTSIDWQNCDYITSCTEVKKPLQRFPPSDLTNLLRWSKLWCSCSLDGSALNNLITFFGVGCLASYNSLIPSLDLKLESDFRCATIGDQQLRMYLGFCISSWWDSPWTILWMVSLVGTLKHLKELRNFRASSSFGSNSSLKHIFNTSRSSCVMKSLKDCKSSGSIAYSPNRHDITNNLDKESGKYWQCK